MVLIATVTIFIFCMKHLFEKYKIYGFRKFLRFSIGEVFYNRMWMQIVRKSFAQKGEDVIIDNLLGSKKKGSYVDIGAYDPHRFSNTKRFYLRGWCGINVEPDFNNYKKFVKDRKRDINLNIGIAGSNRNLTFFKFIPDTLSTFSEVEAAKYEKKGYKLAEKIQVKVRKLRDVLREYCENKAVDFISIDTEGYGLEVLKSNDWRRFRPKVMCVESTVRGVGTRKRDMRIEKFLLQHRYKKICDIGSNSIFFDRRGK